MIYEKEKELIADIKKMEFSYTPEPTPNDTLLLLILYRIPFFYALVKRMNTTSSAIIRLAMLAGQPSDAVLKAAKITPIVSFALNIIDFLEVPLIYIAAYSLNEKLPAMTLSTLGKWLYSSILLTLYTIALINPIALPIITLTASLLVFVTSVATLGKIYYYHDQNKNELKDVIEEINKSPVTQLHQCALELEKACRDQNDSLIIELMNKIEILKNDCEQKKEGIKALYQKKYMLEESIKIESTVMDNCVSMVLSSLTLTGAVVSLFFPPIGLGILIGVSLAGSTYAITQFTAPYVMMLVSWIKHGFENKDDAIPQSDVLDMTPVNESTANITKPLTKEFTHKNPPVIPPSTPINSSPPDKPTVQLDNTVDLTNDSSVPPLTWPNTTSFMLTFSTAILTETHRFTIEPNDNGYTIKSFTQDSEEIRQHALVVTRDGKVAASVDLAQGPTDTECLAEKMVAAYIAAGNDRTDPVKIECSDPELDNALRAALEKQKLTPICTGHANSPGEI